MLPLADTMCISWVKEPYEGDTYFPEVDFSGWKEERRRSSTISSSRSIQDKIKQQKRII